MIICISLFLDLHVEFLIDVVHLRGSECDYLLRSLIHAVIELLPVVLRMLGDTEVENEFDQIDRDEFRLTSSPLVCC